MGGTQQLARLAGGLAGLGLAIAAAAPFSGVPPQGVSGALAPAQVEVRALASGELLVDPVGVVLEAAPFPAAGQPGGPFAAVKLTNITGSTLRITMRLTALSPALDDAVMVRASAAGGVLADGPLRDAGEWSQPAGVIASGEATTLRIRFKLKAGLNNDAYRGRLDVRQLELKGVPLVTPEASEPSAPEGTTPGAAVPGTEAEAGGADATKSGAAPGNASAAVYPPVASTPNVTTTTPGGNP